MTNNKREIELQSILDQYHCGDCLNPVTRDDNDWRKQMNKAVDQLLTLQTKYCKECYEKGKNKKL